MDGSGPAEGQNICLKHILRNYCDWIFITQVINFVKNMIAYLKNLITTSQKSIEEYYLVEVGNTCAHYPSNRVVWKTRDWDFAFCSKMHVIKRELMPRARPFKCILIIFSALSELWYTLVESCKYPFIEYMSYTLRHWGDWNTLWWS